MKKLVFAVTKNSKGKANPLFMESKSGKQSVYVRDMSMEIVNGFKQPSRRGCWIKDLDETDMQMIKEGGDVHSWLKAIGVTDKFCITKNKFLKPQYEGHQEAINPETKEELGFYLTYVLAKEGTADIDETVGVKAVEPVSDFIED